jgi:gliding motility-associated-like protein
VTTTIQSTVTIDLTALTSDVDNNIDLSTLQVLEQPASGAMASIDAGFNLVVDYSGLDFAGTDQVTIQVCDVSAACSQEVITIEVAGDITVFNALSPNGDTLNEVFIIQYIDLLPETKKNKVTIFNRWGDIVFSVDNYDNQSRVFRGLNKNGDELPTGTYFYKLEFPGGAPAKTGFISLRK